MAYEHSLAPDQQTPYTAKLATLLQAALPTSAGEISSETQRTVAWEAVKRLDDHAAKLIRQIRSAIVFFFMETPERAAEWGFTLKQSTGRVRLPQTRTERAALLTAYIAAEQRRPEAERFSRPNLAEVMQVRDELYAALTARDNGKAQRQTNVAASRALTNELVRHLQAAVVYLATTRYNFALSLELQQWGFELVVPRSGPTTNGHSPNNGLNGHDI